MNGWGLAIDYGTSFTAAAISSDEGVEVLEVEDARRFPSSVLAAQDGSLVVGRGALNQARRFPEAFERSPKRLLGQPAALLGGQAVEVVAMVAAVMDRVADAARMRQGSSAPSWVRLTHPAGWGPERCDVLRVAAARAGLEQAELLSEPEAAAWFFVDDRRGEEPVVGEGECVAVYDLGGGTFDTAILRRAGGGFRLAGPPGGLDWFGGEDFDQRLYDWVLGRVYELDQQVWRELSEPQSPGWRRARLQLREDVRQAKEALSTLPHVSVPVSKGDDVLDVEITRREFEKLIEADLQRTVEVLEKTARDARVSREEIAAVYLTGGSSRVPLAAALASQFHPSTYTRPDPKTLVAQGALAKPRRAAAPEMSRAPVPAAAATVAPPAPPPPSAAPRPLVRRGPRLTGRPVVGRTLTAKTGSWAKDARLSVQWMRRDGEQDWEPIPDATGTSYELTDADAGRTIAAAVTGTDGSRTELARTAPVGPVARAAPARRAPDGAAPADAAPADAAPARVVPPAPGGAAPADAVGPAPATTHEEAAPAREAPQRTRLRLALLGGGIVGAAALGLVLGSAGSGGTEPASQASARGTIANQVFALRYGEDWRRDRDATGAGPPLEDAVGIAARDGSGKLVAGLTDAKGPELLPAAFLDRLDEAPGTDDPVRLGKVAAYRYSDVRPKGADRDLRIYVAPTTSGVVTLECSPAAGRAEDLWPACEAVATTLRLKSGRAIPLGPSKDFAERVRSALRRLARARSRGLGELRRAGRAAGQASSAASVATAYGRAADALGKAGAPPQAAPATRAIVTALRATGAAYTDLAAAARSGSRRRWNGARATVKRREAAARRAVQALERLGYESK